MFFVPEPRNVLLERCVKFEDLDDALLLYSSAPCRDGHLSVVGRCRRRRRCVVTSKWSQLVVRGSVAARNSGHHKSCVRPDTAITVAAHPQNDVNGPLIRTFISVALHASLFLLVGEISARPLLLAGPSRKCPGHSSKERYVIVTY